MGRVVKKQQLVQDLAPEWIKAGGDPRKIQALAEKAGRAADARKFDEAEKHVDAILALVKNAEQAATNSKKGHQQERGQLLDALQKFNVQGIEDYLGWAVVEPREG